jgi:hypothetical protein
MRVTISLEINETKFFGINAADELERVLKQLTPQVEGIYFESGKRTPVLGSEGEVCGDIVMYDFK